MRRAAELALYIAVPAALVLLAGAHVLRLYQARQQLALAAALQELSNAIDRPIAVGSIKLNLASGATISDFRLFAKDGALEFSAEQIQLRWSPGRLLLGRFRLPGAVYLVAIRKPLLHLRVDSSGRTNFDDLIRHISAIARRFARKPRRPPPRPPVVYVTDGTIHLAVASGRAWPGRSFNAGIHQLRLSATLSQRGVSFRADASIAGLSVRHVSAYGCFVPKPRRLAAWIRWAGANIPGLIWLLPNRRLPVSITSGASSGQALVYASSSSKPWWTAAGEITNLGLTHPQFGSVYAPSVEFRVTGAAALADAPIARWRGVQASLRARIAFGSKPPIIAASVRTQPIRISRALSLLPAQLAKRYAKLIRQFQPTGAVAVAATVAGPIDAPELRASLAAQRRLSIAYKGMQAAAASATASIAVHNLRRPAAVASVRLRGAEVSGLPPVRLADKNMPVRLRKIPEVPVQAAWVGGKLAVSASVDGVDALIGEVALRGIAASAALAGDTAVANLSARVLSGRLNAHACLSTETRSGHAFVDAAGVDLKPVAELFAPSGQARKVSGTASATALVAFSTKSFSASGAAHVSRGSYGRYSIDSADALFHAEPGYVEIPGAVVTSPAGLAVAWGALQGEDLRFAFCSADVDLARAAAHAGQDIDVSGRAWLTGTVSGRFDAPAITFSIIGRDLTYSSKRVASLAVASGQWDARGGALKVDRLLACRRGAAAKLSAQLSDLSAKKPYASIRKCSLAAVAADIGELVELAGADLPERLNGMAYIKGQLSGPADAPRFVGKLLARSIAYGDLELWDLAGPVRFDGRSLIAQRLVGHFQAAEFTATVSISDVSQANPRIDLALSTRPVQLARIPQLTQFGIVPEGTAAVENASLTIEGGALKKAAAKLRLRDIALGPEKIGSFTLSIASRGEQIEIAPVSIAVAGGRAKLSGFVNPTKKRGTVQLSLDGCQVPRLLALAGSVAVMAMEDREKAQRIDESVASWAIRTRGKLGGRAKLQIDGGLSAATFELALADAIIDGRPAPVVRASGKYLPDKHRLEDLRAQIQYAGGLMFVTGTYSPDGEVSLLAEASGLQLSELAQWIPTKPDMSGSLDFAVQVSGDARAPLVRASADAVDVVFEGVKLDLLSVPVITIREGSIDVDTLLLKRREHELRARVKLPFTWQGPAIEKDRPIWIKAGIRKLDLRLLAAMAAEHYRWRRKPGVPAWASAEITGFLDATAELSGTLSKPVLDLRACISGASFRLPQWRDPISDIALDLSTRPCDRGVCLSVNKLSARWQKTFVEVTGTCSCAELPPRALGDLRWDMKVAARATNQPLPAGNVARTIRIALSAKSTPRGTLKLTFDEGLVGLQRGALKLRGGVELAEFDFSKLHLADWDLDISGRDLFFRYGRTAEGLADISLTVANPKPGAPAIATLAAKLQHVKITPIPTAGRRAGELRGPSAAFPNFQLRGGVDIGPDVVVKTAGLVLPIKPARRAVTIAGTLQRPRISAYIEGREGRLSAPGGVLLVRQFIVTYRLAPRPPARTAPVPLEMIAEVRGAAERVITNAEIEGRYIGPVRIHLLISGRLPGQLRLEARSDPPLPEEQIFALLGSQPLGALTTSAEASGAAARQFLAVLATGLRVGVLEPIEQQLRMLLGLAELTITLQVNQPVEIRLGKYLVENLLVSYQRSIGGPGETHWRLAVSYEVGRRFAVSYITTDEGDERFAVDVRRTF